MATRPRSVSRVMVNGKSLTQAQAEAYRYLNRQMKPKTPEEVGKAIKKTRKTAWKLLNALKREELVEKTNKDIWKEDTDDYGNVLPRHNKGQGKYYAIGSRADPERAEMRRLQSILDQIA